MSARRWWVWLAPLCFALFPILSLYAANVREVPAGDLLRPGALVLGAALILGLILAATARDGPKTAVLLAATLFLFFSYGQLRLLRRFFKDEVLIYFPAALRDANPNVYELVVWSALFLVMLVVGLRSRRDFAPLASILLVVGAALVAVPALTVATTHRRPAVAPPPQAAPAPATESAAPARAGDGPDIYYIVLDAYGRQDILRELYRYDNEPFLRELKKRGFYVARRGRPNYVQTALSLASSLNMTYLDRVAPAQSAGSPDLSPISQMIDRNAVAAFLRERGYRFVAITNEFPLTAVTSADVVLGSPPAAEETRLTSFEGLLLDRTPLAAVPRAERTLYDQHREVIRTAFDHLEQAPALPGPKFVYAHILAPHPPFVLGPDGEPIQPPGRPFTLGDASDFSGAGGHDEYRRGYVGQLRYVNRRVLAAIDALFARSARRPIVIVQGDHGPRMLLDWQSLARSEPREAFANLNALSLPDGSAARVFPPDLTPVNSFRLLFNHQFGTRYARLPDRSYYSTMQKPYAFTDVTDRITR